MSLYLDQGSTEGLSVKSWYNSGVGNLPDITLGTTKANFEITMEDFCEMVKYALYNTNLKGTDDPRVKLIEWIANLKTVEGFNGSGIRLVPKKERK